MCEWLRRWTAGRHDLPAVSIDSNWFATDEACHFHVAVSTGVAAGWGEGGGWREKRLEKDSRSDNVCFYLLSSRKVFPRCIRRIAPIWEAVVWLVDRKIYRYANYSRVQLIYDRVLTLTQLMSNRNNIPVSTLIVRALFCIVFGLFFL